MVMKKKCKKKKAYTPCSLPYLMVASTMKTKKKSSKTPLKSQANSEQSAPAYQVKYM